MDRMIERVARAIAKTRGQELPVPLGLYPDRSAIARAMNEARAAIEAMREPTWQMEEAFKDASRYQGDFDIRFSAAIDAALSEPPSSTEGAS